VLLRRIADHAAEVIQMLSVNSEIDQVNRCEDMAELFEDAARRRFGTVPHTQARGQPITSVRGRNPGRVGILC
jgi:hypothetical protein